MPHKSSKTALAFFASEAIHTLKSPRQSIAGHTLARWWFPMAAVVTLLFAATLVVGQSAPPSIPAIALTADPLYAATGGDKPVIALALSVEFPTVGAQYLTSGTTDSSYSNLNEYLGYYDAESCYSYNDAPTESPATGLTASDYKRFDRTGPGGTGSSLHMCTNAFSGNFLNWASSSAIDMMRLALSGGDRYIDTTGLTVLQRAVIPNGDPTCFWNSSNFPGKELQKDGGGTGKYWGAVPTAMVTQAAGSSIWVSNTLNRIYFGTSNTGTCGNTAAYILGAGSNGSSIGPITSSSSTLPSDAVSCATQNNTCSFTGTKEVWYGASVTTQSGNSKNFTTQNYWKVAPASAGVACTNNVFGDPLSGTTNACYIRPYSGTWTLPTGGGLNSDGFFYARVQVCNAASGTLQDVRDYGLCKQYPNGNYKPTGTIQKYSDQLRLAAFGYLMDQTASYNAGRYGGVLRAPMKYVGAKTFDIAGQDNTAAGGNPNAEWDSSTGVFKTNPDGDTTQAAPISGVINYLNKFGRTGAVAGRYKIYDPVGELHYEVLRYLQGLQPSTDAVSNITADMYDGFPVATTWTDPYGGGRPATGDYSCLKSNIVTIGDIHTHDGNRLPAANIATNIPDINYWRSIVQSFEKNQAVSYIDGQGASQITGNPNGANNAVASSTTASQILGTSYWGRTHDIRGTDWTASPTLQRPGLRTKSFFFDVNEYGESSIASNRQYSNQFFTAAKYGGFETFGIGSKPFNRFGNPFKRQDGTNDNNVWQDPARPGEAGTYYLQSSARGVLSAFDSIFSSVSTSARSIAGAGQSGSSLTPSGGNSIYQAAFDTADWSGDVFSVPLSITGTTVTIGTETWSAAARLSSLTSPATSRSIVIGKPGATAAPVATAFTWAAIDAAMQTNLAKLTPASASDSLGQARLDYLRGDRSGEGSSFRVRNRLLGDIVNSGIAYSGIPAGDLSTTSAYKSFVTTNAGRPAALFVGANDGMLHAFNASNGNELFGYIPSWMGSKLAALTSKTYAANHQAYVDGTPVVAEAQVGTSGTSSDWKSVLVSGTGAGGSGVFALDVTDPTAFSASSVMWEFTRADDADLGYVVGRPHIRKLRTSAPGAATPTYRWFALVASGVNNYVPDPIFAGGFSTTGKPALFLLALDKAAGAAWTEGTNYYKISVPVDSALTTGASAAATGLINFIPISTGAAGELTQIYMGDLHGKLWKLDFALRGSAEWSMDKLSSFKSGSSAPFTPYPLYIAQTATGALQTISMAPAVVPGPTLNGIATTFLGFATGKYLESSDKTSIVQNSIYEIFDNGSTAADTGWAGISVIAGRGRLKSGSVNTSTGIVDTPAFNWGRAASDADVTQRSGLYIDFPVSGERGITNIKIAGDYLHINSLIPASAGAAGSCTAGGGDGRSYRINYLTGKGTSEKSGVGFLGAPLFMDLPSQTTYTVSTTTGQRTKTTVQQQIQQGSTGLSTGASGGSSTAGKVTNTFRTGRLSWRQINNYQDLKNAP